MSDNGTPATVSRILSLDQKRVSRMSKGNDFITVQQAYDMVIQECAKVHEHYLQQIPTYVAKMTQDALVHYGLIVPLPENGVETPHGAPAAEVDSGNTAEPQSGDAVPPADATAQPTDYPSELQKIDNTILFDSLTFNRVPLDGFTPSEPAS